MYGAGPNKISQQVTLDARKDDPNAPEFTKAEAESAIKDYFRMFKGLAKWIETSQKFIGENGFTYSHFGRKRRLPNVFSTDRAIQGHTVRSGLNFLVQSTASDVNLLAAIDMTAYIEKNGMKAKIFALVHDSILAEVPNDEIEQYREALRSFVQADRGISIPGTPIGCDFELAEDYSMGLGSEDYLEMTKYEIYEMKWDKQNELNRDSEEA